MYTAHKTHNEWNGSDSGISCPYCRVIVADQWTGRQVTVLYIMSKLTILYTHRHTCITVTVDITANP